MSRSPLRVLYVEDEPDTVLLLAHALRRAGFDPSGARVQSRDEFLAQLDSPLDLILSDFTMPGFTGLDALRLMKNRKVDIPFIFVSGTIGEEDAVAAMQEGAADYLMKDRLARLGPAIQQALARGRLKIEKLAAEKTIVRLASIVESSGEAIIAVTDEGVITSWNSAAEQLYGYSAEEICGRNLSMLVPKGRRRTDAADNAQELTARLKKGAHIGAHETVRVRKDSRRIEVLVSMSPIFDAEGAVTGTSVIAHDITERKRSERYLDAEQAVTGILTDARDLEEAGPRILKAIAESMRWDIAVLWIIDSDANVLRRMHSWHSPWANAKFVESLERNTVLEMGSGIAGRAWSAGEPVWESQSRVDADAADSDAAYAADADGTRAERCGLHGGFGLPMRQGPKMLGVIEFYNPMIREPDAKLVATLDNIASQICQFCERRHAEAALGASEVQFRELADAMPQIVWTAGPDGTIDYFNDRWRQFAGCPRGADVAMSWSDVIHPEDRTRNRNAWAESNRSGAPFEIEVRLIEGKTGRSRWFLSRAVAAVDDKGTVTRWYGTSTDIDDQKRSLEDLRISEEHFRNLVLTLPAAVYTTDRTGFITLFNERAATLWGRRPEIGKDRWTGAAKMFRSDGAPLAPDESPMAVALREGHCIRGAEIIIERPDGTKSCVLKYPELLRGADGEIVGAVNMLVDLTQMKQMEEQFRQAQKMETVGRLAGGVAHDFNNLLTVINGYGELLLNDLAPQDPKRSLIEEVIRAGERATSLTRQLLAFSRQQVLCPRVLNLNAVLADTASMLRRLVGEDVEMTTIQDPALGNIKADPGQMEQVLLNLAVNARDAMPRGGRLTITTRNVDRTSDQLRGQPENAPGEYVSLTVSDNGCGMDESIRSRIFEPFFTTKGANGTGLGLATVFGIVKQSLGTIEVVSEPGRGASFTICIPRVAEPISAAKKPLRSADVTRGSETILLAEDEEGVRTLTRHLLETNGYAVLEASSGAEAMRIFETRSDAIDLLITDVVMPRMSGRELAEQLIEKRPGIKVLYLSGYTNDAVLQHGVRRDQTHFLQKPFNAAGLALKVRNVLNAR
jgi:two-component system, cell cycle sensor histidine kinase and response regulator CckA